MVSKKVRVSEKIMHDEYFGEQPSAVFLITVRLVLLCLMTSSLIMIFCALYGYPGNMLIPAGIAACAAGFTYILASLFPAWLVYGTLTAAGAGFIWIFRDKAMETAARFADIMLLRLDSRLLKTAQFISDPKLKENGLAALDTAKYENCFFIVAVFLAAVCAVMFTAAVRTRFRASVPIAAVTIVTAPAVAAETAGYEPSFILFLTALLGFEAVSSSYDLDSRFIYGSLTAAHNNTLRGDREFTRLTRKLIAGKRVKADALRYHRYTGNMIALAALTAAVFFGAGRFIPDGKGLSFNELIETVTVLGNKAAENIGDVLGIKLTDSDDRGYFSDGSYVDPAGSISLRPPGESDKPVLEVKLSRGDIPVYLRGDIGVEFSGNSWTSVRSADDRYLEAVGENFYPETEYQVFRRLVTAEGGSPDEIIPLQMVTTNYIKSTRVVFEPLAAYELNYRSNSLYDCFGDFILRAKSGYVRSYDELALTPSIGDINSALAAVDLAETDTVLFLSDHTISVPDMSNEYYLTQTEAYRGFIDSTYRKSDPVIDEFASSVPIKRYDGDDGYFSEAARRYCTARSICDYFAENFTYSLSEEPADDILGDFLYKTKSGHCALFATAMTLTLRKLGIPARYVTGYAIYPEELTGSDGNYTCTLTERRLHAWTEVYFRGIGWLPFDPTADVPGYAESVYMGLPPEELTEVTDVPADEPEQTGPADTTPAETAGTEENADTEASETTSPSETTAPAEASPTEQNWNDSGLFPRLLPIITIMAVILALTVITLLFFRSVSAAEKRTFGSFRTLPPTEATALMYRFVMTLLEKKGLTPGNEQFYDFAERVDGSIELKGLNSFLMDVMPVFEKCEFGDPERSPVTEDERDAVYRYTAAVYAKIMNDVSSVKRFFMKISLFL